MLNKKKFKNYLKCICNNIVIFELIPEVECDWGIHTLIQCPKCEELFSIDVKCPAFQNILKLLKENTLLYTDNEISDYLLKSHCL